jgi:2-amino-4-hydroxy-6-hydroxymethyldihydropteridine diphosphokinase
MTLAFIGLGSNLGTSVQNVRLAMERLQALSAKPLLKSSLWQTTPIDCPPGSPAFINAVVGLVPRVGEKPESLLGKLQQLELDFGRKPKTVINEPRPLDLDLLVFGNEAHSSRELKLPHPRAHTRRFVLEPLAELAPSLVLPGQSKTVAQLLAELPPDPEMRKVRL